MSEVNPTFPSLSILSVIPLIILFLFKLFSLNLRQHQRNLNQRLPFLDIFNRIFFFLLPYIIGTVILHIPLKNDVRVEVSTGPRKTPVRSQDPSGSE